MLAMIDKGDGRVSIYDLDVQLETGETYSLSAYQGDVLLIVNTATKCGFAPQFKELEALYQAYQAQGFVVLGFPSNQFKQEVNTAQEAAEQCRLTYGVTFPMHQLIQVNGEQAHPLFQYLTEAQGGLLNRKIKWNFTKFLVDRTGKVVKRYAPNTSPADIRPEIEILLAASRV